MVEAEGVENFVLHRAGVQATPRPQRDRLSSTLATDVGPAPDKHTNNNKNEGVGAVCRPHRSVLLLLEAFFPQTAADNKAGKAQTPQAET